MFRARAKEVLNSFKSSSYKVAYERHSEAESLIALALSKRTHDVSYLINTRVFIRVREHQLTIKCTIQYHDRLPVFSYQRSFVELPESLDVVAITIRAAYSSLVEHILN